MVCSKPKRRVTVERVDAASRYDCWHDWQIERKVDNHIHTPFHMDKSFAMNQVCVITGTAFPFDQLV